MQAHFSLSVYKCSRCSDRPVLILRYACSMAEVAIFPDRTYDRQQVTDLIDSWDMKMELQRKRVCMQEFYRHYRHSLA